MGSQGGIGNSTGRMDGNQSREPKSSSLVRQGSIYNLTLDEVQHHLRDSGKPLSSMNLDELLKTAWSAEVNHIAGDDFGEEQYGQFPLSLNHQSSLTLPGDLTKKTVDEVWQDIQQGHRRKSTERKVHDRQLTFGEMTLEDFLVKAGVVAEPISRSNSRSGLAIDPLVFSQEGLQQQAHWMKYQMPSANQVPAQQHQQQQNVIPVFVPSHPAQEPIPIGSNPMLDVVYADTALPVSPSALMGTLSDIQTPARKRLHSGEVMEHNVERRQKRMIKNRESAARSRARRQAYTNELEIKVTRLEEENERLKRQNDLEKMLPIVPPPEPKYQLRRTSSAPF